ncbi:MAG: hypothetical protein HQL23_08320, partial [Candidatus Omnitrophica bacterium]|nr:hypothetical protein [Candidatus Omnitrophota bacterium]
WKKHQDAKQALKDAEAVNKAAKLAFEAAERVWKIPGDREKTAQDSVNALLKQQYLEAAGDITQTLDSRSALEQAGLKDAQGEDQLAVAIRAVEAQQIIVDAARANLGKEQAALDKYNERNRVFRWFTFREGRKLNAAVEEARSPFAIASIELQKPTTALAQAREKLAPVQERINAGVEARLTAEAAELAKARTAAEKLPTGEAQTQAVAAAEKLPTGEARGPAPGVVKQRQKALDAAHDAKIQAIQEEEARVAAELDAVNGGANDQGGKTKIQVLRDARDAARKAIIQEKNAVGGEQDAVKAAKRSDIIRDIAMTEKALKEKEQTLREADTALEDTERALADHEGRFKAAETKLKDVQTRRRAAEAAKLKAKVDGLVDLAVLGDAGAKKQVENGAGKNLYKQQINNREQAVKTARAEWEGDSGGNGKKAELDRLTQALADAVKTRSDQDKAREGKTGDDLVQAEAAYDKAKTAVDQAQRELDAYKPLATEAQTALAEAERLLKEVTDAQAQVDKDAIAKLNEAERKARASSNPAEASAELARVAQVRQDAIDREFAEREKTKTTEITSTEKEIEDITCAIDTLTSLKTATGATVKNLQYQKAGIEKAIAKLEGLPSNRARAQLLVRLRGNLESVNRRLTSEGSLLQRTGESLQEKQAKLPMLQAELAKLQQQQQQLNEEGMARNRVRIDELTRDIQPEMTRQREADALQRRIDAFGEGAERDLSAADFTPSNTGNAAGSHDSGNSAVKSVNGDVRQGFRPVGAAKPEGGSVGPQEQAHRVMTLDREGDLVEGPQGVEVRDGQIRVWLHENMDYFGKNPLTRGHFSRGSDASLGEQIHIAARGLSNAEVAELIHLEMYKLRRWREAAQSEFGVQLSEMRGLLGREGYTGLTEKARAVNDRITQEAALKLAAGEFRNVKTPRASTERTTEERFELENAALQAPAVVQAANELKRILKIRLDIANMAGLLSSGSNSDRLRTGTQAEQDRVLRILVLACQEQASGSGDKTYVAEFIRAKGGAGKTTLMYLLADKIAELLGSSAKDMATIFTSQSDVDKAREIQKYFPELRDIQILGRQEALQAVHHGQIAKNKIFDEGSDFLSDRPLAVPDGKSGSRMWFMKLLTNPRVFAAEQGMLWKARIFAWQAVPILRWVERRGGVDGLWTQVGSREQAAADPHGIGLTVRGAIEAGKFLGIHESEFSNIAHDGSGRFAAQEISGDSATNSRVKQVFERTGWGKTNLRKLEIYAHVVRRLVDAENQYLPREKFGLLQKGERRSYENSANDGSAANTVAKDPMDTVIQTLVSKYTRTGKLVSPEATARARELFRFKLPATDNGTVSVSPKDLLTDTMNKGGKIFGFSLHVPEIEGRNWEASYGMRIWGKNTPLTETLAGKNVRVFNAGAQGKDRPQLIADRVLQPMDPGGRGGVKLVIDAQRYSDVNLLADLMAQRVGNGKVFMFAPHEGRYLEYTVREGKIKGEGVAIKEGGKQPALKNMQDRIIAAERNGERWLALVSRGQNKGTDLTEIKNAGLGLKYVLLTDSFTPERDLAQAMYRPRDLDLVTEVIHFNITGKSDGVRSGSVDSLIALAEQNQEILSKVNVAHGHSNNIWEMASTIVTEAIRQWGPTLTSKEKARLKKLRDNIQSKEYQEKTVNSLFGNATSDKVLAESMASALRMLDEIVLDKNQALSEVGSRKNGNPRTLNLGAGDKTVEQLRVEVKQLRAEVGPLTGLELTGSPVTEEMTGFGLSSDPTRIVQGTRRHLDKNWLPERMSGERTQLETMTDRSKEAGRPDDARGKTPEEQAAAQAMAIKSQDKGKVFTHRDFKGVQFFVPDDKKKKKLFVHNTRTGTMRPLEFKMEDGKMVATELTADGAKKLQIEDLQDGGWRVQAQGEGGKTVQVMIDRKPGKLQTAKGWFDNESWQKSKGAAAVMNSLPATSGLGAPLANILAIPNAPAAVIAEITPLNGKMDRSGKRKADHSRMDGAKYSLREAYKRYGGNSAYQRHQSVGQDENGNWVTYGRDVRVAAKPWTGLGIVKLPWFMASWWKKDIDVETQRTYIIRHLSPDYQLQQNLSFVNQMLFMKQYTAAPEFVQGVTRQMQAPEFWGDWSTAAQRQSMMDRAKEALAPEGIYAHIDDKGKKGGSGQEANLMTAALYFRAYGRFGSYVNAEAMLNDGIKGQLENYLNGFADDASQEASVGYVMRLAGDRAVQKAKGRVAKLIGKKPQTLDKKKKKDAALAVFGEMTDPNKITAAELRRRMRGKPVVVKIVNPEIMTDMDMGRLQVQDDGTHYTMMVSSLNIGWDDHRTQSGRRLLNDLSLRFDVEHELHHIVLNETRIKGLTMGTAHATNEIVAQFTGARWFIDLMKRDEKVRKLDRSWEMVLENLLGIKGEYGWWRWNTFNWGILKFRNTGLASRNGVIASKIYDRYMFEHASLSTEGRNYVVRKALEAAGTPPEHWIIFLQRLLRAKGIELRYLLSQDYAAQVRDQGVMGGSTMNGNETLRRGSLIYVNQEHVANDDITHLNALLHDGAHALAEQRSPGRDPVFMSRYLRNFSDAIPFAQRVPRRAFEAARDHFGGEYDNAVGEAIKSLRQGEIDEDQFKQQLIGARNRILNSPHYDGNAPGVDGLIREIGQVLQQMDASWQTRQTPKPDLTNLERLSKSLQKTEHGVAIEFFGHLAPVMLSPALRMLLGGDPKDAEKESYKKDQKIQNLLQWIDHRTGWRMRQALQNHFAEIGLTPMAPVVSPTGQYASWGPTVPPASPGMSQPQPTTRPPAPAQNFTAPNSLSSPVAMARVALNPANPEDRQTAAAASPAEFTQKFDKVGTKLGFDQSSPAQDDGLLRLFIAPAAPFGTGASPVVSPFARPIALRLSSAFPAKVTFDNQLSRAPPAASSAQFARAVTGSSSPARAYRRVIEGLPYEEILKATGDKKGLATQIYNALLNAGYERAEEIRDAIRAGTFYVYRINTEFSSYEALSQALGMIVLRPAQGARGRKVGAGESPRRSLPNAQRAAERAALRAWRVETAAQNAAEEVQAKLAIAQVRLADLTALADAPKAADTIVAAKGRAEERVAELTAESRAAEKALQAAQAYVEAVFAQNAARAPAGLALKQASAASPVFDDNDPLRPRRGSSVGRPQTPPEATPRVTPGSSSRSRSARSASRSMRQSAPRYAQEESIFDSLRKKWPLLALAFSVITGGIFVSARIQDQKLERASRMERILRQHTPEGDFIRGIRRDYINFRFDPVEIAFAIQDIKEDVLRHQAAIKAAAAAQHIDPLKLAAIKMAEDFDNFNKQGKGQVEAVLGAAGMNTSISDFQIKKTTFQDLYAGETWPQLSNKRTEDLSSREIVMLLKNFDIAADAAARKIARNEKNVPPGPDHDLNVYSLYTSTSGHVLPAPLDFKKYGQAKGWELVRYQGSAYAYSARELIKYLQASGRFNHQQSKNRQKSSHSSAVADTEVIVIPVPSADLKKAYNLWDVLNAFFGNIFEKLARFFGWRPPENPDNLTPSATSAESGLPAVVPTAVPAASPISVPLMAPIGPLGMAVQPASRPARENPFNEANKERIPMTAALPVQVAWNAPSLLDGHNGGRGDGGRSAGSNAGGPAPVTRTFAKIMGGTRTAAASPVHIQLAMNSPVNGATDADYFNSSKQKSAEGGAWRVLHPGVSSPADTRSVSSPVLQYTSDKVDDLTCGSSVATRTRTERKGNRSRLPAIVEELWFVIARPVVIGWVNGGNKLANHKVVRVNRVVDIVNGLAGTGLLKFLKELLEHYRQSPPDIGGATSASATFGGAISSVAALLGNVLAGTKVVGSAGFMAAPNVEGVNVVKREVQRVRQVVAAGKVTGYTVVRRVVESVNDVVVRPVAMVRQQAVFAGVAASPIGPAVRFAGSVHAASLDMISSPVVETGLNDVVNSAKGLGVVSSRSSSAVIPQGLQGLDHITNSVVR